MDIDMSALRGLVREKEISFDLVVEAIEQALLVAYHHTEARSSGPGWSSTRPPATSRSGPRRPTTEGVVLREYDDTPEGFGRIAATTAQAGDPAAAARRRGRGHLR